MTLDGLLRSLNCAGGRSHEEPKPVNPLKIKTVHCDWLKEVNEKDHHTYEYGTDNLVVRRGQTFKTKMSFERKFHHKADNIVLELTLGSGAKPTNQIKIKCPLVDKMDPTKWEMKLVEEENEGTLVTFEISPPPTALIGRYKTKILLTSQLESGETITTKDEEPDFILLFNPWCKDDSVYISDSSEREEYCMNDLGCIYRGSQNWISPKKWNFGQFETNILACSLSLLEKDKRVARNPNKWAQKRGDPIWVSRIISATVNCQDDDGVLEGNWSGDYSGGSPPTKWNGSVEILQQFYSTGKPVRYGQCWVFSGLVTTVLRSLGIPTRSVTNFASAHDTESSMTIDNFVDENGEEVNLGNDSVWNFHVWNECWMRRDDLPDGYGGWQAVDATPQELSLGLFQTGPAPLAAIKKGEVYLGFDTGFVFAEVNSDRVNWIVKKDDDGDYSVVEVGSRYKSSVGKKISTKAVGKYERNDITHLYKASEGSQEEREAFRKAYGFGSTPEYQKGFLEVEEEGKGLFLDFKTFPDDVRNGNGFSVMIDLKNGSDSKITVNVSAVLHSTLYTGEKKGFIKRQKFEAVPVEANSIETKEFAVLYTDYKSKLVDLNSLRMQVVAKVNETGKMYSDQFEFRLENKDAIQIDVKKQMKVETEYNVTVTLNNPIPERLTGVVFTVEGPGLAEPAIRRYNRPVAGGASAQITLPIRPKKRGNRTLLVDVDCKQVKDLKGSIDVEVD